MSSRESLEDLGKAREEEPVLRRRRPRRRRTLAASYIVPKKNSLQFRDADGKMSSATTTFNGGSLRRKRVLSGHSGVHNDNETEIIQETASDDELNFYR